MGKITIYIKLVDGKLVYRDNEKDHGHTIKTSVDPGDTITWKLDKCSGICEITGIKIIKKEPGFFSRKPKAVDFNEWKAIVSKSAKGKITYEPKYISCEDCEGKSQLKVKSLTVVSDSKETAPPIIIVNP